MTSTEAPPISASTTMGELLKSYPGAQRALFARYHIGGCQSCGFSPGETLGDVCARNENLPVDEVAAHIVETHDADEKVLIDPQQLAEALAGPCKPRLLDIRTREEYEAVNIPGSKLFTNDLLNEIYGSWEKDTDIVIYDHTGDRCLDAAAFLIGHGYANTKALRGGIDAYSQEVDSSLPRYRVEME